MVKLGKHTSPKQKLGKQKAEITKSKAEKLKSGQYQNWKLGKWKAEITKSKAEIGKGSKSKA